MDVQRLVEREHLAIAPFPRVDLLLLRDRGGIGMGTLGGGASAQAEEQGEEPMGSGTLHFFFFSPSPLSELATNLLIKLSMDRALVVKAMTSPDWRNLSSAPGSSAMN